MPKLIIVAGVNGAGKTTITKDLIETLGDTSYVINPDELSPRKAIKLASTYINEKKDFIRETTLTGIKIFEFIEVAKLNLYQIGLIYLSVNNCEICIDRVRDRVNLGGHDVPKEHIIRRFHNSRENLIKIIPKIDFGTVIDSSSTNENYLEIATITKGHLSMTNNSCQYDWLSKHSISV